MIRLTPQEEARAKAYIATILYCADAINDPTFQKFTLGTTIQLHSTNVKSAAKDIYDEICYRNFSFCRKNLDNAISYFSTKVQPRGMHTVQRSPEAVATYIAWFCQQTKVIWDDSLLTVPELDAIKDTILGKTLYDAGLFASTDTVISGSRKTATRTKPAGTPPIYNYKSSGGHQADVPNMVTPIGDNCSLSYRYTIEAGKVGANIPTAYITPFKVSLNSIIPVGRQAAEEVRFGAGHGYSDCKLWFEDSDDADTVCKYCITKFGSKYPDIKVVQYPANQKDKFFEVTTSVGTNAYIKTSKLNEELNEYLESFETEDTKETELVESDFDLDLTESTNDQNYKSGYKPSKENIFKAMSRAKEAAAKLDLQSYNEGLYNFNA